MNVIFTAVFLASSVALLICAPAEFLPALLDGGLNAAKTCLTLFTVYVAWMGLSAVAEDCGLTKYGARLLSPVCRKIFKTDDGEAIEAIAMNMSCNLLGLGGAATPFGVRAIERLEKNGDRFAQNMLFIINATSVQLVPTTVIALRAAAGSRAAYDVALPALLATVLSTGCAVLFYIAAEKIRGRKIKCGT